MSERDLKDLREEMTRCLRKPTVCDRAVRRPIDMRMHGDELNRARDAFCNDPCGRDECCKCVNTPEVNQMPYFPPEPKLEVHDPVKFPMHYTKGTIEVIDFIRAWNLNYAEGNVIKYLIRYKHKDDPVQDLRKAQQYIEFLIEDYRRVKP